MGRLLRLRPQCLIVQPIKLTTSNLRRPAMSDDAVDSSPASDGAFDEDSEKAAKNDAFRQLESVWDRLGWLKSDRVLLRTLSLSSGSPLFAGGLPSTTLAS